MLMISITDVVAVIGICITAFKTGYVIGKNSRKKQPPINTFCFIFIIKNKMCPQNIAAIFFAIYIGLTVYGSTYIYINIYFFLCQIPYQYAQRPYSPIHIYSSNCSKSNNSGLPSYTKSYLLTFRAEPLNYSYTDISFTSIS